MQINIGKKIGAGYTLVLILLLLLSLFMLRGTNTLVEEFSSVIETNTPAIIDINRLQKLVVDMETGERGFIITGDESFLTPYHQGQQAFRTTLERSRQKLSTHNASTTHGDDHQGGGHQEEHREHLNRVEWLVERWIKEAATPEIAMRRELRKGDASAEQLQKILREGAGKSILDALRSTTRQMIQALQLDGNLRGELLINTILKAMVDRETGQRGFLVTGEESFLEPYIAGERLFEQSFQQFETLLANAHNRQATRQEIEQLSRLNRRWREEIAQPAIAGMVNRQQAPNNSGTVENQAFDIQGESLVDDMQLILSTLQQRFERAENGHAAALSAKLLNTVVNQETGLRGYLLSGQDALLEPYRNGGEQFQQQLNALQRLNTNAYDLPTMRQQLEQLKQLATRWEQEAATPEIAIRREMNRNPLSLKALAEALHKGQGKAILDEIRSELDQLVSGEQQEIDEKYSHSQRLASNQQNLFITLTALFLLLIIALATWIIRSITRPVQVLQQAADAIGQGELETSLNIDTGDEIGELANSFQQMATSLLLANEERNQRSWIDNGIADLNTVLRGEKAEQQLANAVLKTLSRALGASVGVLYLRNEQDGSGAALAEPELQLFATYAYNERKNLSNHYRWGQGVVGQAALEAKVIRLSNVPDDYIKIHSGLGETTPYHIIVTPFLFENEVRGVIELGTLEPLNAQAVELLERSMEAIGIAFESANSRQALDDSLQESRALTEELQAQQEELQETNEQLEEQTSALDQTRREVEERNGSLINAQTELTERAQQLAQSSKYKSEFLANMSHELRTPLNSILLLSKMLASGEMKKSEDQRKNAEVIYSAGNDLLLLINEVLDLAKIESGKMATDLSTIHVREFAQSFNTLFRPQAEQKGLTFKVDIEDQITPDLYSDRERLQQVLRNFLSNALKFTDSGSITLKVSTANKSVTDSLTATTSPALRQLINQSPEDYLLFSVVDNGIGIAKDKLGVVFEAFQQADGSTSRNYGGTGLGLSISREIADLLEGALALESSDGQADHGTTFSIVVPLEPSKTLQQSSEHTQVQQLEQISGGERNIIPSTMVTDLPASGSGELLKDDQLTTSPSDERILLVVEDDRRFANILMELGRKNSFKVIHAASGTEGVRHAEHYLPSAILLDIQLPIMDGWGVIRQLKSNPQTSHIPVHIISVVDDIQLGRRLGAVQYLVKPVDPERLNNTFSQIEQQLERSIKKLLVVEDNEVERDAIIKLLSGRDIECTGAGNGADAIQALSSNRYDAFILDLHLPDMDGYQVLETMDEDPHIEHIPTIVYTGQDLSIDDERRLRRYAESIVLKTAESPARLLEETTIFLHRVQANLSEEKQKMIAEVNQHDDILKGQTVLLVDDDIRNTFALTSVLEMRGMEVITALNGEEGLELLEQHKAQIGLVLMDIMMPVMDGYEATRKLRENPDHAELPVIALTAKALKEDQELSIEAGASDYMSKPIDYDQLFSLMRVWLSASAHK
ncbi:MAG: response regulator [Gammaproteobacteria bacterium]|nr:response regulator [Gammaproteobacteria bacterium]MBT4605962.1 response regulator [Thiotrichales bacterium]MBT3471363.1 response regulator [Gammaproteobacteria bacterium]MBT4080623.1 response regulator [Gammaproteobacteria bacterium]MBT4330746.1 response regulator [Gammaproteobacteria bacterium]